MQVLLIFDEKDSRDLSSRLLKYSKRDQTVHTKHMASMRSLCIKILENFLLSEPGCFFQLVNKPNWMVNKPKEIHLRYVNTVLSLTSCSFSMVLKLLPQTNISVLSAPFLDWSDTNVTCTYQSFIDFFPKVTTNTDLSTQLDTDISNTITSLLFF